MNVNKISVYQVKLEGVRVQAGHGVYHEEKLLGNHFLINICVHIDILRHDFPQNMEELTDYAGINNIIHTVMKAEPMDLLEKLAQKIAEHILSEFQQINAVELELKKLKPLLIGQVDASVVFIKMER